jgi:AbrB family looped-hinge helix DNA binding protein
MKIASKVGERGQVVIPKKFRDNLGLDKNTSVEFELKGATLVLTPKTLKQKTSNFDLAMKRYGGSLRKQMLNEGFASTDELMDHIRGR